AEDSFRLKRTTFNSGLMWLGVPFALVHDAGRGQSRNTAGEFHISVFLRFAAVEQQGGLSGVHLLKALAVNGRDAIPRTQAGALGGTARLNVLDAHKPRAAVLLQVDAGAEVRQPAQRNSTRRAS